MEKVEIIARRILGWKLQTTNKWFNMDENTVVENFQPENNLDHALLISDRLQQFGFQYTVNDNGEFMVCFKSEFIEVCETGETLAQAITDAAYSLAENNPIASEWF